MCAGQPGKTAGSFRADDIVPAVFQPENITPRATAHIDNGVTGFQMDGRGAKKREGSTQNVLSW